MNARKALAATLLALVLLGFSPLAPKSVAATVNPCGTAQQALEKDHFQQAISLYTQLSSTGLPAATQACARQGAFPAEPDFRIADNRADDDYVFRTAPGFTADHDTRETPEGVEPRDRSG